jgi:hypothetical protein
MNVNSTTQSFEPAALAPELPPLAIKYLTHAIRSGARLAHRAEVTFSGSVRMKPRSPWLPFKGQEIIEAGKSYRVKARARLGPLPVTTEDWYEAGAAASRILLLGLIPVMKKQGEDAARSGRGRLVVESTWLPTTFLPESGASWSEEGEKLQLNMPVDNEKVTATFELGENGRLKELRLARWSDLAQPGKYEWLPFAAYCEAEQTFGDYTVPAQLRAVWQAGTNQEFEFFRTTVENIQYWP